MNFKRNLPMLLPADKSGFLWGARKVGKSSFLKDRFPLSTWFDLLDTDLFFELTKQPSLFRQRIIAEVQAGTLCLPVIVDEVQKVPLLLDEIHWLIENMHISFVLCGSSARKLKRGHGNLLGGRARRFEMKPLVSSEIPHMDLLKALNRGLIPSHYLDDDAHSALKSYVVDYLKEEIMAEGLARNIPAFSRFTDMLGFINGETVNYSNISRDCGVDAKTVREYFQILVDTLIGYSIEPFTSRPKREIISKMPKFYLFDTGLANFLSRRKIVTEKGTDFGHSFEHFIALELIAYSTYSGADYPIHFWRSRTGLEVDFILGNAEVAIEVKGTSRVDNADLNGLHAFGEDYAPKSKIVVCNEKALRKVNETMFYPWRLFLEKLWSGEIIK